MDTNAFDKFGCISIGNKIEMYIDPLKYHVLD